MRLIASDPRAYFIPWWRPDTSLRDTLTASGVAAESFGVFLRPHRQRLLPDALSLLPKNLPETYRQTGPAFFDRLLWALLVAFSRITVGDAHFLTDTAAGCAIVLTAITFTQLPLLLKGLLRSSKN